MRITSFNLENLFSRYLSLDAPHVPAEKAFIPTGVAGFDHFGNVQSDGITQLQRNHTARVILDAKPDVLAVMEVESLKVLRLFNDEFLSAYFDRMMLIEGNDGRGINVGLCIRRGFKARVVSIQTHADEALNDGGKIGRFFNVKEQIMMATGSLFSRDCLEVDIDIGEVGSATPLTFLVNHFKSQSGDAKQNDPLRKKQATRVAELARLAIDRKRHPIVLGDLNADWNETRNISGQTQPSPAAESLGPIKGLVMENVLADPFPTDPKPWTHHFIPFNTVSRLDYILVHTSIANGATTEYHRRGMSLKCTEAQEERYPCIAHVGTEASDHAAISVDIMLPPASPIE